MLEQKEFTVKSSDLTFRVGKVSPIEIIALRAILDFNDLDKTVKLITFILERVEVNMSNSWYPVKEKGREIYSPVGIENSLQILDDIAKWFIKEVIIEAFTQSNKSNQDAM